MTTRAHLLAAVPLPGGDRLLHPAELDRDRVLRLDGDVLAVHDLDTLLGGRAEPAATFPFPWPGWEAGAHGLSPDGTVVALSGQRSVRAVTTGGETLWEHRHRCWDARQDHPHDGTDGQVCPGLESGSCRFSADGAVVWAHVVGDAGEEWLVLDAKTGAILARAALDSVAAGSCHLAHPDGLHMGLSIGEGQDGALVFWGRWDGTELTVRALEGDRILADVRADAFLTLDYELGDLTRHAFPDGTGTASLPGAALPPLDPDEEPRWDFCCGYVDGDRVLASTADADADFGEERHWLLDATTLALIGRVVYPGHVTGTLRPLGDGTWLTWDDGRLLRWTIDK